MAVDLWPDNIGIQMNQKELTKTFYDNFKLNKPFGLYGLYKKYIQRFKGSTCDYFVVVCYCISFVPAEWCVMLLSVTGPATVRMVSNNGPPMPMPMQVPPGHMVQQIVDENGILTHVILSPQPTGMPAPPITVGYYVCIKHYSAFSMSRAVACCTPCRPSPWQPPNEHRPACWLAVVVLETVVTWSGDVLLADWLLSCQMSSW